MCAHVHVCTLWILYTIHKNKKKNQTFIKTTVKIFSLLQFEKNYGSTCCLASFSCSLCIVSVMSSVRSFRNMMVFGVFFLVLRYGVEFLWIVRVEREGEGVELPVWEFNSFNLKCVNTVCISCCAYIALWTDILLNLITIWWLKGHVHSLNTIFNIFQIVLLVLLGGCPLYIYTVKPVLRGHPWISVKCGRLERWPFNEALAGVVTIQYIK